MEVICGATADHCICEQPAGHEPPHYCTRDDCGGQWTGRYGTDDFTVVKFPQQDQYPIGSLSAIFRFGAP